MKKLILVISMFLASTISANLIEEVDKLNPEETNLLLQKIDAKLYKPVPESFFTRFTMSGAFGINFSYPREFNSYIDAKHDSFNKFMYGQANIMWNIYNAPKYKILLGFVFDTKGAESEKELSPNVYQEVTLNAIGMAFAVSHVCNLTEKLYFVKTLAYGPFAVDININDHNDDARTTYNYNLTGAGYTALANLSLLYRFNKVFSIGPDFSYQYARVEKLKRFENTVNAPSDITLKGISAGLRLAYNY